MVSPQHEILDIAYELYSENNKITFNQFLDKIVEEDFEEYYEKTLWPKAQKIYSDKNKIG
tara:strand:- start:472 stop:651 length:180 start_codon:yes stop_codon:yes gene_type:complete